jgi:hypothetical protein
MKFIFYISTVIFLFCFSNGAAAQETGLPIPYMTTGLHTLKVGATTTLVDTNAGGMWSSSDNSIASINSDGCVSGVAAGTVVVAYAYADNSFALVIDTVILKIAVAQQPANVAACKDITAILPSYDIWHVATINYGFFLPSCSLTSTYATRSAVSSMQYAVK